MQSFVMIDFDDDREENLCFASIQQAAQYLVTYNENTEEWDAKEFAYASMFEISEERPFESYSIGDEVTSACADYARNAEAQDRDEGRFGGETTEHRSDYLSNVR